MPRLLHRRDPPTPTHPYSTSTADGKAITLRNNAFGLFWRFAIYAGVCLLGTAAMFVIFGQLRFQEEQTYDAIFSNVSNLKDGNFVRIAGVEVGKIKSIKIQDDATARVTFSADDSVVLTEGTRAVIRYDDLIGGRFMALEEGAGGTTRLPPGVTIAVDHTAPALDLDALIGGFRPLFRALDPDQVNALSGELIAAFQGQGPTIGSILSQTAALTSTLADRDELIGQVVVNLNTVLGSLGDNSDKFGEAIDSLSELVHGLAGRAGRHRQFGRLRQRGSGRGRRIACASKTTSAEGCPRNRPDSGQRAGRSRLLRQPHQDPSRRLPGPRPSRAAGRLLQLLPVRHHPQAQRQRGTTGLRQGGRPGLG